MRVAVLAILVCAGLVLGAITGRVDYSRVYAQQPSNLKSGSSAQNIAAQNVGALKASNDLIALSSDVDQTFQQVTLIDTKTRVVSVYHIDRRTGEIALKSVRNVHWDLRMEEFNGVSPSPREIRSLLERR